MDWSLANCCILAPFLETESLIPTSGEPEANIYEHREPMSPHNYSRHTVCMYFSGERVTSDAQRSLRHAPTTGTKGRFSVPNLSNHKLSLLHSKVLDYQCSERQQIVVKVAFFHLLVRSFVRSFIQVFINCLTLHLILSSGN